MVNTDKKAEEEGEIMRYKMIRPKIDTSLQHRIRRSLLAAGYRKDQIMMGHTPEGVYIRSLDERTLVEMAMSLVDTPLLAPIEVHSYEDRGMYYFIVRETAKWTGTKPKAI